MCLKNGSPQRDTIVILEGIADDDEQDRELREAAKRVAALLDEEVAGALGAGLRPRLARALADALAGSRCRSRRSSARDGATRASSSATPASIISTPDPGAGGEEEGGFVG